MAKNSLRIAQHLNPPKIIQKVLLSLLIATNSFVLLGCEELDNTSASNTDNSENISQSTKTTTENVMTEDCPYDLQSIKKDILDKSTTVINHWRGNIWNNGYLGLAVLKAERVLEDPRCEREAQALSLPETINYGNKIRSIGEKRIEETLDRLKI